MVQSEPEMSGTPRHQSVKLPNSLNINQDNGLRKVLAWPWGGIGILLK